MVIIAAQTKAQSKNYACLTLHVFKSCNKRFVQNVKAPLEPIKLRESNQCNGNIEERNSGVDVSQCGGRVKHETATHVT
jgi:hypothetical protein